MFINLGPILKNRNYRLLYAGQLISFLGSMMTYMAVPYQVFQITKSSFYVGMLGVTQLVPLLFFALLGGAYADVFDRKRMLIVSELLLSLCCLMLIVNASLPEPSVWVIFVLTAISSAINGFHRPSLEAITPQLVSKKDLTAIAALSSFKFSFGAIIGPTLSGLIIAQTDIRWSYLLDFASFAISMICIWLIQYQHVSTTEDQNLKKDSKFGMIFEGLKYAKGRAELMGTYIVDIVAMVFAMPVALFPSMSESWGGAKAAGWLYAGIPMGSLLVSLLSGWTSYVRRRGAAVVLSATAWGIAIIALAFADELWLAVLCLMAAGAADMVSGIFRGAIWNETIPTQLRGRLAGMEMLSYMSGPMIGNARAGYVATISNNHISILSGGIICTAAVLACIFILPKFWHYEST